MIMHAFMPVLMRPETDQSWRDPWRSASQKSMMEIACAAPGAPGLATAGAENATAWCGASGPRWVSNVSLVLVFSLQNRGSPRRLISITSGALQLFC